MKEPVEKRMWGRTVKSSAIRTGPDIKADGDELTLRLVELCSSQSTLLSARLTQHVSNFCYSRLSPD